MEKPKNKMKIGLSLLISLVLIIQVVPVLANDSIEIADAGNNQIQTRPINEPMLADHTEFIVPDTDIQPTMQGGDGCFPIDITAISVDGVWEPEAIATGCYDIDVEVCKTEWSTHAMDWFVVINDTVQEGYSMTDPYDVHPLLVEAKCDPDYVYFRFTNWGKSRGNWVNMDKVVIRARYLGTYDTEIGDAEPDKMYKGVSTIPGSLVTRSGGYPNPTPGVVEIRLPRGTGYWGDCCDPTEWKYTVYQKFDPANYNTYSRGWLADPCTGDFYPAEVKKFLEIYKYHSESEPSEEVEIYCEDFEDPCEIYENWATIDMPVWGFNGAIDTWTWSSKRYCDSAGHSMHSTAFDTYLPLQHDILELNMGSGGVDVSAFNEVRVCYNSWVEGDSFDPGVGPEIIQDYGEVLIELDGGGFAPVGGLELQYDSEGECVEVCFTVDVSGASSLKIQWVWKSDEAFCYEGWYVDDVCIYGVIDGSFDEWWELVFSAHSHPQIIEEECEVYVFEPEWCVQQEGTYLICAWLQALDDCHYSSTEYFEDGPFARYCIEVEVGDVLDVGEVDLYTDPECPIEEGTDLAIYSDICNFGTLNATDFQVKVTVNRGSISTVFGPEDVESGPYTGYSPYYHYKRASAAAGTDVWHECTFHSFSGSTSWGWTDPTTHVYPHNAGYPSGARYAPGVNLVIGDVNNGMKAGDSSLNPVARMKAKWDLDLTWSPVPDFFSYGVYDNSTDTAVRWVTSDPTASTDLFKTGTQDWTTIEFPLADFLVDVCEPGGAFDTYYDGNDWRFFLCVYSGPSDNKLGGIWIDDFELLMIVAEEAVIYEQTVIVPYLDVSDCTTVEFEWEDPGVGQYVITQEILTPDDDMNNQKLITGCNIYNVIEEPGDLECIDHTWCEPGNWYLEGCCGGYFWAGDPVTTTYGNDWDTSLYIAPGGNKTLTFTNHTRLKFDVWHQLFENDKLIVERSEDNGLHWILITELTGNETAAWVTKGPYVIHRNTDEIRFRFVSDGTKVNRGMMIDNIIIYKGPWTFFESDCTSFDDFLNKQTPAGCWWFDSMDTQYFVYDTGQLPGTWTWFPDGYLEPSWGVFDNEYFNLGLTGNLFPDNIDTSLIWEFEMPKAFYGWLEKTTYYCIPNTPNVSATLEISIDGGANWDILETYVGSANADYGPAPLFFIVDADYQYWESADVILTDYLTADEIMLRWHMEVKDTSTDPMILVDYAGFGPLSDYGRPIAFYGMYEENPPVTLIEMQGTFDETYGYYTSEVAVWLTATDDIVGVAATYYELDGTQYTYTGPFIVDGDGEHTLCYWSVDNEGNTETKKCVPPFKIDQSGPTGVGISILDGPGIYIFGFKIPIGDNYIILFQNVDVTATASTSGAPLKTVEFYCNDQLFSEDTEAPFKATCSLKNQGAATFKVTAKDVLGKTSSASQSVQTWINLI
jgi:hypothetical protein